MRFIVWSLFTSFAIAIAAGATEQETAPPFENWAMVERLAQDTPLIARLKTGDEIGGGFLALDSDALRLRVGGGERLYPRAGVAEIRRYREFGRRKMVLWGAVAGFAVGFPIGYALAPQIADNDIGGGQRAGAGAGIGAIGAGIGAGLGALAKTSREDVIYRARP